VAGPGLIIQDFYLALVPEAELSADLELVVKTLLLKGTPGDLVGLGIDRDGHCFVKVEGEKERERREREQAGKSRRRVRLHKKGTGFPTHSKREQLYFSHFPNKLLLCVAPLFIAISRGRRGCAGLTWRPRTSILAQERDKGLCLSCHRRGTTDFFFFFFFFLT